MLSDSRLNLQKRAENLRTQIQSTVKQMETAGTELECFRALQKQEQLAASNRINGLWEDVQKQKELERTLQQRYGDLSTELERISHLIAEKREQAQKVAAEKRALELAEAEKIAAEKRTLELAGAEKVAAEKRALELAEAQAAEQVSEVSQSLHEELGSSMAVDPTYDETTGQQINTVHMDVDSEKEHTAAVTDGSLCDTAPSSEEGKLPSHGVAVDTTGSSEVVKEDPTVDQQNVVEASNRDDAFTKQENIGQEIAKDDGFAYENANKVPGAEFDETNLATKELEAEDNLPRLNGDSTDK